MQSGLVAPPETKRAPLRARSCVLVSGLVLLGCLPMERTPNAAALLNEELRACTDEANRADADQRASIELPSAPTPFEDAVPTTLPEQWAEGTSGSCSVVQVPPPLPLTLLQLVLFAVIAWLRAPRGNTSTARAVLPTLLCLLVPKALAQQCASAPTCPAYPWSDLTSSMCSMKQFGHMRNFKGGSPTALPGRGLYRIWKVSKDESNCCYDLEVQGFMCEVMKNKTAVRASFIMAKLDTCARGNSLRTALSSPSARRARRCPT